MSVERIDVTYGTRAKRKLCNRVDDLSKMMSDVPITGKELTIIHVATWFNVLENPYSGFNKSLVICTAHQQRPHMPSPSPTSSVTLSPNIKYPAVPVIMKITDAIPNDQSHTLLNL